MQTEDIGPCVPSATHHERGGHEDGQFGGSLYAQTLRPDILEMLDNLIDGEGGQNQVASHLEGSNNAVAAAAAASTNTATSFLRSIRKAFNNQDRTLAMLNRSTKPSKVQKSPAAPEPKLRARGFHDFARESSMSQWDLFLPRINALAARLPPAPTAQVPFGSSSREEKSPVAIAVEYKAPPPQYGNHCSEGDELMDWLSRPRSSRSGSRSSANNSTMTEASQADTDDLDQSMEDLHL